MILPVVKYPHKKLRKVCQPAKTELAHHRTLARRLMETMKAHKAYGIAANQVEPGELVRIIAVNTSTYKGAMFNPEILSKEGVICEKEGCLSLKEEFQVFRAKMIRAKWKNISGIEIEQIFQGMDAVIIQHEIDHLNGILASDYEPDHEPKLTEKDQKA